MGFLEYFRSLRRSQESASIAKDRLQIIVSRERSVTRNAPDYLPQLQQELLQVLAKYELIDLDQVTVNVDKSGGCEVLELNIVLSPKSARPAEAAKPVAVATT